MADGSATIHAIYNARPTLRFDGVDDPRASGLIRALSMRESEGGLRALEITFDGVASTDRGVEPSFADGGVLRFGAQIEVYLGERDRPCEIFRGRVTAMEAVYAEGAAPLMQICAEDALLAARFARRSAVYTDQSPAQVVEAVAAELGLTPVVSALTTPVATWAQIDETDLAFLRRLLARFDADLQVVGRELQVAPRAEVQRNQLTLQEGRDLHAIALRADLAHQLTSVQARGWDAVAGSAVKAEVTSLTHGGPGAGRDGATLLRDAFGQRADNLGHLAVSAQDQAQALAEAAFDRRARRLVCARGTSHGHPELRVGSVVAIEGCGAWFDNEYYVVSTQHRWDLASGYRTEFEAECAYFGGAA